MLPAHILRVCALQFKDEEAKAVRKADFITQAVSPEPAIDPS